MKKLSIILIFCVISVFLVSLIVSANTAATSKAKMLPAMEICSDKSFPPERGLKLSQARELIAKYLQNKGVKGEIGSSIKVTEITVKEAWDNNRFQLYRIDLDYAWINGVAIIKNGKVLSVLEGMPTHKIFLADLDSDSRYEIYTDVSIGSGISSNEIRGYNIASDTEYSLSFRPQKDLFLFILNKTLWVKEASSCIGKSNEVSSIGKLAVKSVKDKKGIYIKTVKPPETKNNLYPTLPKTLTVDMVGFNKQVKISDVKAIKEITDILNSVELKPFSKDREMGLMASSVGGLRITPDNKDCESIYVHGAGAIYLNASKRNDGQSNNAVFQISKSLIDKLYEIINRDPFYNPACMYIQTWNYKLGMQVPPEIKITLDNKNIGYIVTGNKWNGAVYDGEDSFISILKKDSNISVPYIKLGKTLNIEFKQNPPDNIEIYDYILMENGSRKYDDRTKVRIPVTLKEARCSFELKENLAVMLSSNSEDYKPGRTLRGFKVICKWSNKSANECEYGFVIRTDARKY